MIGYIGIKEILDFLKSEEGKALARRYPNAFVRDSPLNLENLVNLLLFREGKTNQMEIYNFFNRIEKPELVVTKSALSEQRKKLNYEIFIKLNELFVIKAYSNKVDTIEEIELIPVGIDGSVFELPNIIGVKEIFGHSKGTEKSIKTSVARAQVSGAYDCVNDIMLDASINKYGISEKKLAMEHIKEIKKKFPNEYKKMLFIFDRGYIGIPMLLYMIQQEANYLFRLPTKTYRKEISQMTTNDEKVIIPITESRKDDIHQKDLKELAKKLKEIEVRIIKVELDSGETEIILTNIEKEIIPTEKIKEIYYKRWNIEKSYDIMKNKLEIENFSGYTELAIQQDFYAQILLFNIMEDIKKEANAEIKEEQEKSLKTYKYEYIVNMNILIGICRKYLLALVILGDDEKADKLQDQMLNFIKKNLVAIKSGRKNSRHWRRSENNYRPNMKRN